MTKDEIVLEICRRAWALGVSVYISPTVHVEAEPGVYCSGFFDSAASPPQIVVAGVRPDYRFLGTLLHEFNHAEQWAEGNWFWEQTSKADDIWNALKGKKVANQAVKWGIQRDMEADCERRTVRLIKELGADIEIDAYCQAANAYLHFYNLLAETKRWFAKGKSPYEIPEILAQCNKTIDKDFSKTPAKLRKALLEHCY